MTNYHCSNILAYFSDVISKMRVWLRSSYLRIMRLFFIREFTGVHRKTTSALIVFFNLETKDNFCLFLTLVNLLFSWFNNEKVVAWDNQNLYVSKFPELPEVRHQKCFLFSLSMPSPFSVNKLSNRKLILLAHELWTLLFNQ